VSTVISADGTRIGFSRVGDGPPLILVDGALCYRGSGPNGPLATLLAPHFTVYTYDRRGRGDSGDTAPYTVEREVADLAALVKEAGGSAHLYGISSGGALALEAAARGVAVTRLAVYEAPFVVDDSRPPAPADFRARLGELAATGRRAEAVRYFMGKGVGLPAFVVALMRFMPAWKTLKALAHTLQYDAAVVEGTQGGRPLPAQRWAGVTAATLVIAGDKSPPWIRTAMRALADAVPGARHHTLPGQTHLVKPAVLAPVLVDWFTGQDGK
jgi:pimeloyl-ACP methyl ester carboxylesterase